MKKWTIVYLIMALVTTVAIADSTVIPTVSEIAATVIPEVIKVDDIAEMPLEQLLELKKIIDYAIESKTDNQNSAPTPTSRPTATPAPTRKPIEQGSSGDDVLEMKMRLYELGYFSTNSLSKVYTETTADRVKLFQQVNGLPQTGTADSVTLELLFSASAKGTGNYQSSKTPNPYAEYQKFVYKTYARNPENYKLQKFKIRGKVVQVIGDRTHGYELRVATKGSYDDIVYVFVKEDPGYALLEDDRVIIYAVGNETITYESIFGQSITIPAFVADEIQVR